MTLSRGACVLALSTLAACASHAPTRSDAVAPASTQSLMQPVDSGHDLLAKLLAAQFALQNDDLATAAAGFADAATLSDDPALAEEATQLALAHKDWALARHALARWQVLAPQAPGIAQSKAWIALGEGRTNDAVGDLQALLASGDDKAWRLIAQTLLNAPDKLAAAVVLARLAPADHVGSKESNAVAVSQLAFKLGDKSYARRLADAAVDRFHGEDAYAWSGSLAAASDDLPRARTVFAQAIARFPASKRLRSGYAAVLGKAEDARGAALILAGGPQDQTTFAARAAYAARADDKTLLGALYREVLADKGARDGARLLLLGQLAELMEKRPAAIDWYRAISERDDHYFEAQQRLAIVLEQSDRLDEALKVLQRLATTVNGEPEQQREVWLLQADLLGKRDRTADALAVYTQALAALPDDARVRYARALFSIEHGEVAAGERDLRAIVQQHPDNAEALNALGYTISDHSKDDASRQREAFELIKRALELKPEEPAIIDSMGWVRYRLGDLDAALGELRRAYKKQPDADIAAHLGEVLWMKGEHAEARRIWDEARKKNAKSKVLVETIERLTR
ncbi:tetratricopeptide repeat protein [Dokdonella sp.]|uniref:tetratricopeptide repeat protein n=1 Tax=Dokdonella sp. TaxID=2291710 RepID=UPI0025B88732|nr:tetratricopeptide repeat protein [Dokdonella sp.]